MDYAAFVCFKEPLSRVTIFCEIKTGTHSLSIMYMKMGPGFGDPDSSRMIWGARTFTCFL